jgi:hypothetical protein
MVGATTT